ncbi:hypothetical protein MHU86_8354 [Fragilaria crotonensis]|nr:hypothetical protein MHU86_8354 [Fragilaria crotonensis]
MAASITPEEPAECRMVTTEAELSSYIDALEEMNAQLNERVAELNSSNVDLVVMVDALNSEIAQLKVEQNNKDRVAAAVDTLGYVENITLNNEEGICDNEQENVERTQRKRIRVENSELACELALLISNFTSSSVFSIVEPTKVPAKSTCKDCR